MKLGKKILVCATILLGLSLLSGDLHPLYRIQWLIDNKKYKEADEDVNRLLEKPAHMYDPALLLARARTRRELKDFQGARHDLDLAFRLQEANKLLWGYGTLAYDICLESSYLFGAQKLYEQALAETDKALKVKEDWTVYKARSSFYFALNQSKKAISELDRAVAVADYSNRKNALAARAEMFWDLHELDLAIKDVTTLLAKDGVDLDENDRPTYLEYRGRMYADKGDYKSAIADFDQALIELPDYEDAKKHRKECLDKLEHK